MSKACQQRAKTVHKFSSPEAGKEWEEEYASSGTIQMEDPVQNGQHLRSSSMNIFHEFSDSVMIWSCLPNNTGWSTKAFRPAFCKVRWDTRQAERLMSQENHHLWWIPNQVSMQQNLPHLFIKYSCHRTKVCISLLRIPPVYFVLVQQPSKHLDSKLDMGKVWPTRAFNPARYHHLWSASQHLHLDSQQQMQSTLNWPLLPMVSCYSSRLNVTGGSGDKTAEDLVLSPI